MQKYPVRPSHRANLSPEALLPLLRTHFESGEAEGELIVSQFGAISRIAVHNEGRELVVDVTMNPKVPEEVAHETIQRYNRFLQDATGYSSKERAKRLRKSATAEPRGE